MDQGFQKAPTIGCPVAVVVVVVVPHRMGYMQTSC